MEIISQREFSRRVGVSEATVRKAIENGWIQQGRTTRESGTPAIIYETALAEWEASPAGLQAAEKNKTAPPQKKVKTPAPGTKTDTGGKTQKAPLFDPVAVETKRQILEEKQTSSKLENQRRAVELQRLIGKLVDRDHMYKALFEFGKGLRDNITNVADRYIDDIRNAPDRHKAHEILLNGLLEALRGLSSPPDLSNTR